jgi:elongation factor P
MYTSADLRKGLKLIIDGEPYVITWFDFSKPGKGQALYRTKMRNMITGIAIERTYRPGDTFEPAQMEERRMQYLYREGSSYHFMDTKNYEQVMISEEALGDAKNYIKENTEIDVLLFNDRAIGVEMANFVDLKVIKTDPWLKGDTTGKDFKPATVETGYELRVPPYIEEGEWITIDTRTGEFSSRTKG